MGFTRSIQSSQQFWTLLLSSYSKALSILSLYKIHDDDSYFYSDEDLFTLDVLVFSAPQQ